MEEYNIQLPLLAHCAERIDQTVPTWYIFTSPHRNRRQRKVEYNCCTRCCRDIASSRIQVHFSPL